MGDKVLSAKPFSIESSRTLEAARQELFPDDPRPHSIDLFELVFGSVRRVFIPDCLATINADHRRSRSFNRPNNWSLAIGSQFFTDRLAATQWLEQEEPEQTVTEYR